MICLSGGLDDAVTEQIVQQAFLPFGEIAQIVMPTESGTQKHRGFAFVEFDLVEDAEHALFNMNNAELYGRVLKLSYAKPQALAKNKAVWEVLEEQENKKDDENDASPRPSDS